MDNQFKNVKTHARLSSKAMWYEWRMKLLDELKKGLRVISKGMEDDELILQKQEGLLNSVLPALIDKHEKLEQENQQLQTRADELANCDQDELNEARTKLQAVEEEISAKKTRVEQMRRELQEKENGIETLSECKEECLAQIKEAERIREECRGWSAREVSSLKGMYNQHRHQKSMVLTPTPANVDALEKSHGWTITAASGTTLTMTYRESLQLSFSAASFLPNNQSHSPTNPENAPISLTYIADTHEYHPVPLSTEKRFFLQFMRAHLQCLPQNLTKVKELLSFVSESWIVAEAVAEEIRVLRLGYITTPAIVTDELMAVNAVLLLPGLESKTKIEISFEVGVKCEDVSEGVQAGVKVSAKVVYGEKLNESKMGEFLAGRVGGMIVGKEDGGRRKWLAGVQELAARLRARGKGQ